MNCAAHPSEPITGTCERCGNFVCALDAAASSGGALRCVDCRDRLEPSVSGFKATVWGKRDGWAIAFAFGAFLNALGLLVVVASLVLTLAAAPAPSGARLVGVVIGFLILAGLPVIALALDVAYLFRVRRARTVAALFPSPMGLLMAFGVGHDHGAGAGGLTALACVVLPSVVAALSLRSTRNKLAFEIDVPESELRALWLDGHENGLARTAFLASWLGVFVPMPLIPVITIALCIGALKKVDHDASPPVGGRAEARAGIAVSLVATISQTLWCVLFYRALTG